MRRSRRISRKSNRKSRRNNTLRKTRRKNTRRVSRRRNTRKNTGRVSRRRNTRKNTGRVSRKRMIRGGSPSGEGDTLAKWEISHNKWCETKEKKWVNAQIDDEIRGQFQTIKELHEWFESEYERKAEIAKKKQEKIDGGPARKAAYVKAKAIQFADISKQFKTSNLAGAGMHWSLDRVDIPTTSFEELLDAHLSYAEGTKFIQMLNTADPANPVVLPKDWYTNLKAIIDAEGGIDDLKVKLTGWTAPGNALTDAEWASLPDI